MSKADPLGTEETEGVWAVLMHEADSRWMICNIMSSDGKLFWIGQQPGSLAILGQVGDEYRRRRVDEEGPEQ